MKIALDLDGVLAETMDAWYKKANEEFGKAVKLEDLTTWASWNLVGISKDDFYRILDEVWDSWKEIPPTNFSDGLKQFLTMFFCVLCGSLLNSRSS